jgi:hypothetical protein
MPLFQPVAHTLRHRRAIHVKAVGRGVGLWAVDESSFGRRALVGHSETLKPACRALIGLSPVPVSLATPVFDRFGRLGAVAARTSAAHSAAASCLPDMTLRGSFPQSSLSTFPDDALQHGEAPCCAGVVGDLSAYADSEAEPASQLNQCHTRRLKAPRVMQFYSRRHGPAPRSMRAAQASRTGNEIQSNSQT